VAKRKSRLQPRVAKWLDVEDDSETDEEADELFEEWLEEMEERHDLIKIGNVLVDPDVLTTRFACVPERCAPWSRRDHFQSCCSDILVPLNRDEKWRLMQHSDVLADHLRRTEPRLARRLAGTKKGKKAFFLDSAGEGLCRPGGRCIFSRRDSRGRIRCRLYSVAEREGVDISDIQPYTCRIFPLIVIKLERGRVFLTVLDKANYKAFESNPPWIYPCLSDRKLPPLVKSMAGTLDWLFGKGFADKLRSYA